MGSLDLNSMFTNIPQKKSLTFASISHFKDIDSFEDFNKNKLIITLGDNGHILYSIKLCLRELMESVRDHTLEILHQIYF